MLTLVLHFLLPPVAVAMVCLTQRHFGHSWGGRLVGLPMTTAPFLLVMAMTIGRNGAAVLAHGVVAGLLTVSAFCAVYVHIAARQAARRPMAASPGEGCRAIALALTCALVAAAMAGLASGFLVGLPVWLSTLTMLLVIGITVWTWPKSPFVAASGPQVWWEIPAKVAVVAAVVVSLTAVESSAGPFIAGVLSATPILLTVMVPSTHRMYGASAAMVLLGGVIIYLPGSVMFAGALAASLPHLGLALSCLIATVILLTTNKCVRVVQMRAGRSITASRPAKGVSGGWRRVAAIGQDLWVGGVAEAAQRGNPGAEGVNSPLWQRPEPASPNPQNSGATCDRLRGR